MAMPSVPMSWGELFDKLTILNIKSKKITSEVARKNVEKEFGLLRSIYIATFDNNTEASRLEDELQSINRQLWDIEDHIRDKERSKIFDDEFIQLARSVYITNDERSRIKRRINEAFGSELIEEKSYASY